MSATVTFDEIVALINQLRWACFGHVGYHEHLFVELYTGILETEIHNMGLRQHGSNAEGSSELS